MRLLDALRHRFRILARPASAERDLDDELRFHLESEVDDLVARGVPADQARRRALAGFGGVQQVKEQVRDTWHVRTLRDAGQDLRYAARTLRRAPAFTLVATLTIALGVGATTSIFTVVNAVLLEPLRYPESHRIVRVLTSWVKTGKQGNNLAGGDLIDVRESSGIFESLSVFYGGSTAVRAGTRSDLVGTWFVNASFFDVFGVAPAAGRTFQATDVERAMVVSSAFATSRFGSAASALGRTVSVGTHPYEVVGVMPAGFRFPDAAELWVPVADRPENTNRTGHNYPTVGRLRRGIDRTAAEAAMAALSARLVAAYPEIYEEKGLVVVPLQERLVGPVRGTLYLLVGAVALLFLIACANVANLFLARATARSREIALRSALGAGRGRIVRQLLVEGLAIAALGAALGVVLASLLTSTLVRIAPVSMPRLDEIAIDRTVLGFTGLLSLAATVLFALAPAWHASRVDLRARLVEGGTRGSIGASGSRLRTGLAVVEITLAVVLAVGSALLFRSFVALSTSDLGFQTSRIMTVRLSAPSGDELESVREAVARYERLVPAVQAIPGVESAATAMGVPLGDLASNGSFAVQGRHIFAPGQELPHANFRLAGPGYFRTLGIPIVRGRDFLPTDTYDAPFVVIVSEALVRELFPGQDPIGQRLQCGLDSMNWMTIVGVVGDIRAEPGVAPDDELYMPVAQHPRPAGQLDLVVRSALPPGAVVQAVRERIRQADPDVATRFTSFDEWAENAVSAPRFRTWLVGSFAALALLLSAAGIYGLLTYLTAQRTPELGVRMALGAGRGRVLRLVLSRALGIAAVGIVLGLAASLATSRAMTSLIFGVEPLDPLTYAAAVCAVLAVTVCAAAMPAWRASRIDPAVVLRE
jgi:predicted permease